MVKHNRKKNVLILSAHPDDETLGCGGTIRYLASKGYDIKLITFTNGTGARGSEYNRNEVLKDVCNKLGIRTWKSANYPDNKMDTIALLDIIKFIEDELHQSRFDPNIIFTHHPDCLNIDHSLVYKATLTVFRPQSNKNQTIYSYYVPSSTDYNPLANWNGNTYIKLTQEQVQTKMDVLNSFYKEEMKPYPHSRSDTNILNIMKVWGAEVGSFYAEKFQLIRNII
jgi:N-acetylglucosamine malate deacetylase 1